METMDSSSEIKQCCDLHGDEEGYFRVFQFEAVLYLFGPNWANNFANRL